MSELNRNKQIHKQMQMKKYLTILLITTISFFKLTGQTRLPGATSSNPASEKSFDFTLEAQLKNDIDDIGLAIANSLMNCCSSYGGTNIRSDIDYQEVRLNEVTGSFTIPMTVNWQGSLSGNNYWIKGKLIISSNGTKTWLKIKDSGGFYAGCSQGCVK